MYPPNHVKSTTACARPMLSVAKKVTVLRRSSRYLIRYLRRSLRGCSRKKKPTVADLLSKKHISRRRTDTLTDDVPSSSRGDSVDSPDETCSLIAPRHRRSLGGEIQRPHRQRFLPSRGPMKVLFQMLVKREPENTPSSTRIAGASTGAAHAGFAVLKMILVVVPRRVHERYRVLRVAFCTSNQRATEPRAFLGLRRLAPRRRRATGRARNAAAQVILGYAGILTRSRAVNAVPACRSDRTGPSAKCVFWAFCHHRTSSIVKSLPSKSAGVLRRSLRVRGRNVPPQSLPSGAYNIEVCSAKHRACTAYRRRRRAGNRGSQDDDRRCKESICPWASARGEVPLRSPCEQTSR